MDQESLEILGLVGIAIGFPAAVGSMVGVLLLARLWRTTLLCPDCGRRIAKTAFTDEAVHCPDCEGGGRHVLQATPGDATCRVCNAPLAPQSGVRLWDARDYCVSCVSSASCDLMEHDRKADQLKETMPFSAVKAALRMLLYIVGGFLATFGSVAVVASLSDGGGIVKALQGLLAAQLVFLPMILLFASVAGMSVALGRSTVSVRAGRLHVWRGATDYSSFDLSECEWFIGTMRYADPYLGGQAIVIAEPNTGRPQETFVAVGFTPESRQRWEAFLTLAGVERRTAWELKLGWRRTILNVIVAILALPASIYLCVLLAKILHPLVLWATGDVDLAKVASGIIVVPGAIYLCVYMMIYWPWSRVGGAPSKKTPGQQAELKWGFVAVAMLLHSAMIALPLLAFYTQFELHARITGAVAVLLAGFLFSLDVGRRSAGFEWACKANTTADAASPGPHDLK